MKEENFDVEVTEKEAGNLEQDLMTEELTIVESTSTEAVVLIEDFKIESEPSSKYYRSIRGYYYR